MVRMDLETKTSLHQQESQLNSQQLLFLSSKLNFILEKSQWWHWVRLQISHWSGTWSFGMGFEYKFHLLTFPNISTIGYRLLN